MSRELGLECEIKNLKTALSAQSDCYKARDAMILGLAGEVLHPNIIDSEIEVRKRIEKIKALLLVSEEAKTE